MNDEREKKLKKIYLDALKAAGYTTIPELVEILPPTIMNIIGSSINVAEKLFVAALKTHIINLEKVFHGNPPNGINKTLTDFGFMTISEIAEANPTIIAKALKINLDNAGDIVLHAMELSMNNKRKELREGQESVNDLDKEISHYLEQLERIDKEKKLKVVVDDAVQKIHETIKPPSEELIINLKQIKQIELCIEQFMTVFPSCTGFSLYGRRGDGIVSFTKDKEAKNTIGKIHESISTIFWKINLTLEKKSQYGWIETYPHLVWIEAIRDKQLKRQIAYIGIFIFESKAKEGVGTAIPTIKGIVKELERIIYEQPLTE